jgi:hypothetical protein
MALNLFQRLKAATSFTTLNRTGVPAQKAELTRKDFSRADWRRHTSPKRRPHSNYIKAQVFTVSRYVGHDVTDAPPDVRAKAIANPKLFKHTRYQKFLHARKGWRSFIVVPGSMSSGRTYGVNPTFGREARA